MSTLDLKRRRDIRRQRGQFLAVAVTIALGALLFAASYDAYRNLDSSYNRTYDRLAFADITVVGADPGFEEQATGIQGVDAVETRVQADIPMRAGDSTFLGRAVGYPADGSPAVNRIDVTEGSGLDPGHPRSVVIETHMVSGFDIGPGDSVEIFAGGNWEEMTVAGVAVSPEYLWLARDSQDIFPPPGTFGVVFVSSGLFDRLPADSLTREVLITYDDGVDVAATDERVTEAAFAAGAGDVTTRADDPSNSTLLLDVNGFQEMAILFPVMFMTAAGLAAFVLLTRIVYSQRSIIGTMRASGLGRGQIMRHYLSYGVRLGGWSGVVGLALGIAGAYGLTGLYTSALGIPDTVRTFHWLTPAVGVVFGFAAGAVGAWAPARAAFRVSPAEAMRGDVPPSGSAGRSWLERFAPPLRRLPVRWLMVLRGIGRNRRRTLSTILGVVLALMLVMVSWGMIDTVVVMIDRQFNEVAVEDADVILGVPVTDDAVGSVRQVPGVDHIEVVPALSATVALGGESFSTTLNGYDSGSLVHSFPDGLPETGILASDGLADRIGAEVGDELRIELPGVDIETTQVLQGFLDEPVGTKLYISTDQLRDLVGADTLTSPTVSSLQALFEEGASRDRVIGDIEAVAGVGIVVDARAIYDIIQEYLGLFYAFVGMMLVLGGAMAFALMFNTISVNVAERSGEFATMRANGLSHARIARLIAGENVLLTILGIIPGLGVGYVMGIFFTSQFSVDAFTMDFAMRWWSIVGSAVAMLAVALLSLIPAVRTIRRIDIGEVVRERAV